MDKALELVGTAAGPPKFVKTLGIQVPTFTEAPGGKHAALDYHVPLQYRGPFRPKDLANYDAGKNYRTDEYGYVLCYAKTKSEKLCPKRAANRVARCEIHGARLHPLDKVKKKESYEDADVETLSRYQQFLAGQISVDELDDEELANGAFRASNGRLYRPKNLPAKVIKEFHRAIYSRAEDGLRSGVVKAAQALVEIVDNKAVEPADRIKASTVLMDRVLGRAPQQINIGLDTTPFNETLDKIANLTREQSYEQRGITPGYIDAEVEDDILPQISGEQKTISGNTGDESQEVLTDLRDKIKERNPSIIAQTIELPEFKYDIKDNSEEIRKARNRRYAANAIGPNKFKIELQPYGEGIYRVKFTTPEDIVTPAAILKKEKKKRKFDSNPIPE